MCTDRWAGTRLISLKKILLDDGATEETLLRAVRLLLQGMQEHAIVGDANSVGQFRATMQELTAALENGLTAAELLVQAGSAVQKLEDYNRRTARYLKRPAGEWQAVVSMLISTITGMATTNERMVGRLREISGGVRLASTSEEVHRTRLQLVECLAALQLGTRLQKPSEAGVEALPKATDSLARPAVSDGTSGFAPRSKAEEALAAAWQSDPASYVAVMALDRLPVFNVRFGPSVGDEVLRFYSDFLLERLHPGDRIFRWSAHALLVLLPRPNRLEIVRDEVARLMEVRCEHTVQTPSRTILLPIAARWTVFPSLAAPRLLIHKIDAFAETKGGSTALSS